MNDKVLAPNENLTKPVGHHRLLSCVSSGLKQQSGGWVSLLAAVERKNSNWLREIPYHGLRILANRHPQDQNSDVGVE
ncbi:MAG: hypothetical protein JNL58_31100 [Planctomyces sp.]|nr:hypothetical protein [Planctomyces sp.]